MPLAFNNCLFLCSLILANSNWTFNFSNCACKSASFNFAKTVPALTILPSGICKKVILPFVSGCSSTKSFAKTVPFTSICLSTFCTSAIVISTETGILGLNLSVGFVFSLHPTTNKTAAAIIN